VVAALAWTAADFIVKLIIGRGRTFAVAGLDHGINIGYAPCGEVLAAPRTAAVVAADGCWHHAMASRAACSLVLPKLCSAIHASSSLRLYITGPPLPHIL